MEIIHQTKVDMSIHGISTECGVYMIHIKILDINRRAKEIIDTLLDRSWIKRLGVIDQKAYNARAEKTIIHLVENILNHVEDDVTEEFGEYLISDSAGNALSEVHKHKKIALAELWKEQMTGNPGFDFHTESPMELVVFGEAKFKSSGSPYTVALNQIVSFVSDQKDLMELADLQKMASEKSIQNALDNKKGFIAAFSLNAKNQSAIFDKALKTEAAKSLLNFTELYLIGIEI